MGVEKLGLEDSLYSTHSMRRTKPYLIYKKTKNLRVIQLLLGHKKLESTVRYLGIEVDDALEISESIEVYIVRAATAALCHKRKYLTTISVVQQIKGHLIFSVLRK